VSRDLISKVTDKVVDELNLWYSRPLDRMCPVVLVDAIHVTIRDQGWVNHLSDLKNRGVEDILLVACDGLKGLPDAITTLWPQATVQL
jgi:transposase-like protein